MPAVHTGGCTRHHEVVGCVEAALRRESVVSAVATMVVTLRAMRPRSYEDA